MTRLTLQVNGRQVSTETEPRTLLVDLLRGVHGAARASGEKGVQVHLCRISSAAGLELVRQYRTAGAQVTASARDAEGGARLAAPRLPGDRVAGLGGAPGCRAAG